MTEQQKKWGGHPRRKYRGGEPPAFGNTVAIAPAATPPATSWWLVPPEEFADRQKAELNRIQGTGFGKRDKLITSNTGVAQ